MKMEQRAAAIRVAETMYEHFRLIDRWKRHAGVGPRRLAASQRRVRLVVERYAEVRK